MKNDASGLTAKAPCYFERRFLGPNASGTWPAFWLLTDYMTDHVKGIKVPCDELDIIDGLQNPIGMRKFGILSTWFETFHTYGCKITETDTIYFCDNIEVGRHATLPLSRQKPFFLLINLATGGGWPVDLSRYNGVADMYVDYVRVYQGEN
jgi:beta-glucanase (GH16 family)